MPSERSRWLLGFAAARTSSERIWKAAESCAREWLDWPGKKSSILIVLVYTDSTTNDYDDYAISAIDWNEE